MLEPGQGSIASDQSAVWHLVDSLRERDDEALPIEIAATWVSREVGVPPESARIALLALTREAESSPLRLDGFVRVRCARHDQQVDALPLEAAVPSDVLCPLDGRDDEVSDNLTVFFRFRNREKKTAAR